jgi:hypothetical protein
MAVPPTHHAGCAVSRRRLRDGPFIETKRRCEEVEPQLMVSETVEEAP